MGYFVNLQPYSLQLLFLGLYVIIVNYMDRTYAKLRGRGGCSLLCGCLDDYMTELNTKSNEEIEVLRKS